MAERTHNKPRFTGIPIKIDRPSQILSFTFLFDRSTAEFSESKHSGKKNIIRLSSNEIKFFHSQKSVWFRQLLKRQSI